jgi:hypothetical protein
MLSALCFLGLTLLNACKKTGELSPAFSEGELNAKHTDTITVYSATERDDSVRTFGVSKSVFGSYNDPVFGLTTASFYTQLGLTTSSLEFPTGTVIDSVVLKLAYTDLYANAEQSMQISVQELSEAFVDEGDYFNFTRLETAAELLGSTTFVPNLADTFTVDSIEREPHVRIALDKGLGDRLLGHGPFQDNADFTSFFKGLYVQTDTNKVLASGDGTLLYFNLLSASSRLVVYFHYTGEGGVVQNSQYPFGVTTTTPRYNHFNHHYEGTEVEQAIGKVDVQLNYVQPLAGVKTKITFPFIRELVKDRNIVVNKAELFINVNESSNDFYAAPARLVMLIKDASGTDVFVPDFFEGTSYFGGSFDINTQRYRFNIARYIDGLINEKIDDQGLFLIVSGNAVNANRLILNSGRNQTNGIKLRLTYTQL